METRIEHAAGTLTIAPLNSETAGKSRLVLRILPRPGVYVHRDHWETAYSEDLIRQILASKGLPYLIDEIRRDEDPASVEIPLGLNIRSFVPQTSFEGARLLDFGCGSGASTMVLARMFPDAEIIGVELNRRHVETARKRAEHHGVAKRVSFLETPDAQSLPSGIGSFDHILFCAVIEHLLPAERPRMLQLLWSHLRSGGHLFINDRPYRWFPVETHTTSLPLINYLPDRLAFEAARRLSRRVPRDCPDDELLRLGVRGATGTEIVKLLVAGGAKPEFLEPSLNGTRDHIDLWARHSEAVRGMPKTRVLAAALRFWRLLTGVTAVPTLSLALRKPSE